MRTQQWQKSAVRRQWQRFGTRQSYLTQLEASASTWIFTIARNKRIDAIRKIRRPEPDELTWPDEIEPAQEEALELKQQSEILVDAIQNLPEKQRQLVEKAFFKELSHSEIALETGLPLGTIKSRIRLALERLRHAMG